MSAKFLGAFEGGEKQHFEPTLDVPLFVDTRQAIYHQPEPTVSQVAMRQFGLQALRVIPSPLALDRLVATSQSFSAGPTDVQVGQWFSAAGDSDRTPGRKLDRRTKRILHRERQVLEVLPECFWG